MKRDFKIISVLILIMLIVYFYMAVDNAHKKSDEEGHRILSDAIIRSAVQCYAIEGFYPPGIEYLENNYGLLVDHDKYFVRASSSTCCGVLYFPVWFAKTSRPLPSFFVNLVAFRNYMSILTFNEKFVNIFLQHFIIFLLHSVIDMWYNMINSRKGEFRNETQL